MLYLELVTTISAWLAAKLVRTAPQPIDPSASFQRLGVDTRTANELAAYLTNVVGRPVSPISIWRYPTPETLAAHLTNTAVDLVPPTVLRNELSRRAGASPKIAFVFSGLGGQWLSMGRGLLREPHVYDVLEQCSQSIERSLGWSLLDLLTSETDASLLRRVEIAVPAIVAIEIAIAAQWNAWGLRPDVVAGLSIGEIAAAHVTGALSLDEAMRIICEYGRNLVPMRARRAVGTGVVGLSWEETQSELRKFDGVLFPAIELSVDSTVISGERAALDKLFEELQSREVFCRHVVGETAPHCPLFDEFRADLFESIADIVPRSARTPFLSAQTGAFVPGEALDAQYWVRNLAEPALFSTAIRHLIATDIDIVIEIGPHPVALPGIEANLRQADRHALLVPSLLRDKDEWEVLADALRMVNESIASEEAPRATSDFVVSAAATTNGDPVLRERVLDLPPGERESVLLEIVREQVAAALGLDERTEVPLDRPLREIGLDSVLAVTVRSRLSAVTGLPLRATLLFNHPTVLSIGRFLMKSLVGTDEPTALSSPVHAAVPEADTIAIVAMSARFPGDVQTPEDLWNLVRLERDAVSALPDNRGWNVDTLYDPDPDATGKSSTREGGFVYDADHFDPAFFGISRREAVAIDPQQRLLLEGSWEVLERAGIVPKAIEGTKTGVFVGAMYGGDYASRIQRAPSELEGYLQIGSFPSVAAGRIAYTFDLRGPTVTIDTACSSSLVAIHAACQSLLRGECSLALAGGVTVMATPATFISFSRQRATAPDGRCKAFSADANGAGWAEGAGMLLLERLSDARRHGHPVVGILRGSAITQDGRSQGLSAPNGLAQECVIRDALLAARLDAREVDVIDAHGTGTGLGDPIEADALFATYGQAHSSEQPLWLGSLKSNIGHAQAAAGVGSVIKMLLAMKHGVLPKTLHAETPSPHIDWSSGAIRLLHDAVPWPERPHPKRAGVSSFGVSGTNAHVILEEPERPLEDASDSAKRGDGPHLLLLSGRSDAALQGQAQRLRTHLESRPDLHLVDLAYSLATTRSHFEHRAALVVRDREEAIEALGALARGTPSGQTVLGHPIAPGKLVFVFPGQGTQWEAMARDLLETSPVFRNEIDACERAFAPHVDWSLTDVLRGAPGTPPIDRLDVVQPVLFAMMVALAAHWRALGIQPDAVIGHSQGEIAAAYVAGALSLEDAARVVTLRSRALTPFIGLGGMAAVQLAVRDLEPYLAPFGDRVAIAAVNSPSAITVAGELAAVENLLGQLDAEGIQTRMLRIDFASHCALVEGARDQLLLDLAPLRPRKASIPFYSTLTNTKLEGTELDADYWFRNVRQPVRFADASRALVDDGYAFFVELGPHPALSFALDETAELLLRPVAVIPSLRRNEGDLRRLLLSLGELHTRGYPVDWKVLFEPLGAHRVELPTYAFQRERFWLDANEKHGTDVSSAGLASAEHPMLGTAIALAGSDGFLFTARLSLADHPWLSGHAVFGRVLLPGTAFVELALIAARHVGLDIIDELTLEAPLLLTPSSAVRVQLSVDPKDDTDRRAFAIYGRDERLDDAAWTRFASGTLARASAEPERHFDAAVWPPPDATPVPIDAMYERFRSAGLAYGPAFRGLRAVYRRGDELFADVALPDSAASDASAFAIHPALLDAALHASVIENVTRTEQIALPFAWSGVALFATAATSLRVHIRRNDDASSIALDVADATGQLIARIDALTMRTVSPEQLAQSDTSRALFQVDWSALRAPTSIEPRETSAHWVLLGNEPGLSSALQPHLRQLEEHPTFDAWKISVDERATLPDAFVLPLSTHGPPPDDLPPAARRATEQALTFLQAWLADDRSATIPLILLTQRAIATRDDEDVHDLVHSPIWGLVRSAQTEHPDAPIFLVDSDDSLDSRRALLSLVPRQERQLALRNGRAYAPRLAPVDARHALAPPDGTSAWALAIPAPGTLDNLTLAPNPHALAALSGDQVRIAVHAAGLNFRDILVTLGMYPDAGATLGSEVAGVVLEVGKDVSNLAPGDRVMGLAKAAFGPVAITDHRLLCRIPRGWSFVDAASVPAVFLTAYYCLIDIAELQPGERVLVHAAAGGVGMAATQIARHLGAEVFATASPGKWDTLRSLGFDEAHIASSRDLEFESRFAGAGVDVVLNSLARDFIDASFRLLPNGGRFVEMGKTDLRDRDDIATRHPGIRYQAFDLLVAAPERTQQILAELAALFDEGKLRPLPISVHDIRQARRAFRSLSQAQIVGKIVLTLPRPIAPQGTVLITGGTGTLGRFLARHLVQHHDVRHLLLTSRRGPNADGALALKADLEGLGAHVTIAACDVSNRVELERLLASIASDHPLTAVVHAAGSLDDGLFTALTPERLHSVLRSKVDAAVHLHELTESHYLAAFVLYSSVAGVLGFPGQANYASANTFLDALAAHRKARGLPALSLDWGYWQDKSGLTATLSSADLQRVARSGLVPISREVGLALFDAALARPESTLFATSLDRSAIAKQGDAVHPLFHGFARGRVAPTVAKNAADTSSLKQRLLSLSDAKRSAELIELVRSQAALVLGSPAAAIPPERPLKELGLDSLMAVEIRNRLNAATGLRLRANLLFDHPTPKALARFLLTELLGSDTAAPAPRRAPAPVTTIADDPIAIVAMSCRLPGGVRSPEDLWKLLAEERDAASSFPDNRGWDVDAIYDPDPSARGKTYARQGGFLYDADLFDPAFFAITPREALAIDPQHRLLLETSWETIERAGIDPATLHGSPTGVFVGIIESGYGAQAKVLPDEVEAYLGIDTLASVASGRIAHTLGLEGPAVSIDTACSSSLVAIHLACQALRLRECSLALAGGVTVMANPALLVTMSRQRAHAPDGRCKAFSAEADGMGSSEGAGMLLLERLSDARRHGHPVLAVLRGSAINQDGRSQGLTAPNGPAQERLIRQTLDAARLEPRDIDAVEAHGTGTVLGDPIEAHSLLATYGRDRDRERPLWLGSLKSNIGHTQAAAGVAGIIKMVLAIQHGILPKTLHAERPSPHIDWSSGHVQLLNQPVPWHDTGHPRRAAVSSFGISGTNAHVILEEPRRTAPVVPQPREDALAPVPLLLSAKSGDALQAQAQKLRAHLDAHPDVDLIDLAYSLATTRSQLEHRAVLIALDRSAATLALDTLARALPTATSLVGTIDTNGKRAFLFTGQGSQLPAMGRGLYDRFSVFRQAFDDLCSHLDPRLPRPLREVLLDTDPSPLHQTLFAQPALFALEVALFRLVASWGLEPDFLLGHSIGELAAAHIAGVLSLQDACALVAARATLMQALPRAGLMYAVETSEEELALLLAERDGAVDIAAINGPSAVVISGDEQAVLDVAHHFEARGRKAKRLSVSHAFHSHHMDGMLEAFAVVAESLDYRRARIPIVSTLTGKLIEPDELSTPEYWVRQVRQPVRFADAVRALHTAGARTFVELGPDALLSALASDILATDPPALCLSLLRRKRSDVDALFTALGELHAHGHGLDWNALFLPFQPRRVPLPTYAFQRERFWLDAADEDSADVRRLVRTKARSLDTSTTASSLEQRLHSLSAPKRIAELVLLVRTQAALVCGTTAEAIPPERPLKDIGLDSLMAVEIRNRLAKATGLRLGASLLFDYPSPRALAGYLLAELLGSVTGAAAATAPRTDTADDPIAIVAMSCRLPGGVRSPEDLWKLLTEEREAISSFPINRGWDVDALYDPDPNAVGKTYAREGGFLHDADSFDPAFFAISPREALAVDPQHRLLLETSWETLERAGIDPATLHGSPTGVFVGVVESGYGTHVRQVPDDLEAYIRLDTSSSIASGRIAYTLGLEGPAVSIDTACSSSLVAIHLACQALRNGECSLVLAGGVTVMATPSTFILFSRQRAMAPDGRCKAFSADANGAGWSEGAGMLLLERLSDARRHGHPILAVLRSSAINQDGKSQGLTAPNGPAQERVIRRALAAARLTPGDIDAVEAHGTGTALGDPIEARALLATYGQDREESRPLWLGSLKSNIGHTQAAAGVAGVIKMVLAIQHGVLPKTLHAERPSPHIDWSAGHAQLLNEAVPWHDTGHPRRAAVSSFGISGTNAHVILEEPPPTTDDVAPPREHVLTPLPFLLSAKSDRALHAQAEKLREHLDAHPDVDLGDLAYSLATTRSHFDHRVALLPRDRAELTDALGAFARGADTSHAVVGTVDTSGKLALLFTGQGSQLPAMGRGLYDAFSVFKQAFDEACEHLDPLLPQGLREVLFHDANGASLLDQTLFAQPALFALEVALFRLCESWGLVPDILLGHSIGELVAAHVAGVFSLPDACTLVAARAKLMQALPQGGLMGSLEASEQEVRDVLASENVGVDIAAINGPSSVVISGDHDAVLAVSRHFESLGRKTKRLRVSHAFHSHHMDGMLEAYASVAKSIHYRTATLPIVSNLTGNVIDPVELASADYWVRQVRQPVRFADGVRSLRAEGARTFLELGPDAVLAALATEALASAAPTQCLSLLRKGRSDIHSLFTTLGALHVHGHSLDWNAFFEPFGAHRVELPTYAFQYEPFWLDAGKSAKADVLSAGLASADHPMLGAAVALADTEGFLFTAQLSLSTDRWLSGHAVLGHVLLPGTAFVEFALVAGRHIGLERIEELTLEAPLLLTPSSAVRLQVAVDPTDDAGRRAFSVFGRDDRLDSPAWTRFASGTLGPATSEERPAVDLQVWPPPGATSLPIDGLYERLHESGLQYGPAFQGLRNVYKRGDDLFAEVILPDSLATDASGFALHPALLDAALHAIGVENILGSGDVSLPFSWAGVALFATGATSLRVRIRPNREDGTFSLDVAGGAGQPVARIDAFATRPVSSEQLAEASTSRSLFHIEWTALPEPPSAGPATVNAHWIRVEQDHDLGAWKASLDRATSRPDAVIVALEPIAAPPDLVSAAHRATQDVLTFLQDWLADERSVATPLILVTRHAVATRDDEDVHDLVHAAVWGLVRSAQAENPDVPIFLLDSDDSPDSRRAILAILALREPQLALRSGRIFVPRLTQVDGRNDLPAPTDASWALSVATPGTFEGLALVPNSTAVTPLASDEVRIAVHAAGLNFRDVLVTLGMYPDPGATLGGEVAGVVLEVGRDVSNLAPGDRVMGIAPTPFGPVAVADHRLLTRIPTGWSFVEAASVPTVFLTAYYCLVDVANLQPGERVLIHAAAGGVGMAATQIARHLGADVFATASPGKWDTLRALGFDDGHIASSRTLDFEDQFLRSTAGAGMDVVLNSLAREFIDASFRLLPNGGRFVEIGKTDPRDPDAVAARGIRYQTFDLAVADPERTQQNLAKLSALFEARVLRPIPITTYDVRCARRAFRALSQAQVVGKIVLTVPRPLDPTGTVLITGGTGTLGGFLARHLVQRHGVRHLLLTSRRGPNAAGALALKAALEDLGAAVSIAACDVSNRAELEALFATIPGDHPLTAVVHAAGSLDDGLLTSLTPERLHSVLRSKLDAAVHLHELTQSQGLAAFVLYSSVSGVLGAPGQANYAAANVFLDALADHRRARGLPALSLDWGYWQDKSGITGRLSDADRLRIARSGFLPISEHDGLALFDAALARTESTLLAVPLDLSALAKQGAALSSVFRRLVRVKPGRPLPAKTDAAPSLKKRLLSLPESERHVELLQLVRTHTALVFGTTVDAIQPERPLKEVGLDSLMAVEIRNRLAAATGLRLRATLLFDYPSPGALMRFIDSELIDLPAVRADAERDDADVRSLIATIPLQTLRDANLLEQLVELAHAAAANASGNPVETAPVATTHAETMSDDELIAFALGASERLAKDSES